MDLTSVLLFILFTIVCSSYLKTYRKKRNIAKVIDQLPGDKKYPIIGSAWDIMKAKREDFFEVYRTRNKKYGPFYRVWLGSIPSILTWKPEHIQTILTDSRNINKSDTYKFLRYFLDDGLFTSQGDRWRHDRKLITPSFHLQILENFLPIFNERSRTLAKRFEEHADTNEYFDAIPLLERLSFDFICETSVGLKVNALEEQNIFYMGAFIGLFAATVRRIFNPLIHNNYLFYLSGTGRIFRHHLKDVKKFVLNAIEARKRTLEEVGNNNGKQQNKKRKMALLDNLLEAYKNLEHCDYHWMYVQVFTFVFAGFDTTASALIWTLYCLAINPDVQEKLYQEIKETFQDDMERDVTLEDLKNMNYLDRTAKESLRLYTVAPVMSRKIDQDIILDNLTIPSGCTVSIQLMELHRDPNIYPDPEKFDPDRFLPENANKRHPYSYVPFSAGYRNCIGQKFSQRSVRVAVVQILKKYRISAKTPPEKMKIYQDTTIKPQEGLLIKLEKRC